MQEILRCGIVSLNVRGLRDQIKRRSIFSYLRDQKATFCFLQETYSNSNDEVLWKAEGEVTSYFLTLVIAEASVF